jgi:hypothetical protein
MQPRQRPARAAAVRCSALGQLGADPASMQRLAMRLGIVSPVALGQAGLAPGTPRASAQRGNGVDKRQQLSDVLAVGTGERRRERDPAGLGDVMLRPAVRRSSAPWQW